MSKLTRRALSEALSDLLAKKTFEKITVGDITRYCGVNRMTFYYHFKDIFDLVEWTLREKFERAVGDHRTLETWQEGYLRVFLFALEEREFIRGVCSSVTMRNIQRFLANFANGLIVDVITKEAEAERLDACEINTIAAFYQYAMTGIFLRWVLDGMKEEPTAVVARVAAVVQGTMHRSIHQMALLHSPENTSM